jgi:adenylosuccinate lyase
VGSLVFYSGRGLAVRARFCAELGLAEPAISWLSSRDRGAEFAQVLALICGTLARLGTEVYELQRPEIGELAESAPAGAVGSITMPHKRNPEASEHLDTLARLVRAQAGVMVEAMVQEHERDGRGWKAEWVVLPETCLLTAAALQTGIELTGGLQVNAAAMRRNAERGVGSEQVLARLAPGLGARRAQTLLHEALAADGNPATSGRTAARVLAEAGLLSEGEGLDLAAALDTGACGDMIDLVIARARAARATEAAQWPS